MLLTKYSLVVLLAVMARHTVTDDDEGKHVVNQSGDTVGMVSGVRNDALYVDPDPGLTDKVKSALGWDDIESDDYPLKQSRIDTITDDEVRLKR